VAEDDSRTTSILQVSRPPARHCRMIRMGCETALQVSSIGENSYGFNGPGAQISSVIMSFAFALPLQNSLLTCRFFPARQTKFPAFFVQGISP